MLNAVKRTLGLSVVCVVWSLSALALPFKSAEVYTSYWPPYVNEPESDLGVAQRVVELVYYQMGLAPDFEHLDYYFSYQQLERGYIAASFPYFKTQQRAKSVLFSEPLMTVENSLFYSAERPPEALSASALQQLNVGRVAGYSYGEALGFLLPNARVYASEVMALRALLMGEIDLLPVSTKVAQALIQKHFPHKIHVFKHIDGFKTNDSVHLIAPKTAEGEAFIRRFNQALTELKQAGVLAQVLSLEEPIASSGYVQLLPAEGFPVVTGYMEKEDGSRAFYVIPQGSRARVIAWHDVVLNAHTSEKIFEGMMQYSKVQVVDGPHAGKSLFVRNMHLGIE